MQTVVLTHRLYEDGMRVLNGKVNIKITDNGNPREIQEELRDADAFIIRIGSIDRETILACQKLKVIGRPGVGVDTIDIKTATEKGIPIVIAPGGNTRSVAEHTLALILAASKNLLNSDCRTRAGDFNVRNKYKAFEVLGKTLGLVGFGNIGRELANLGAAVGMSVSVFDPFIDAGIVAALGYTCERELDQLLANADVVSLHVPLTEKTRTMIGARELKLMKPDGILINCSRGEVVDEGALAEALKAGQIHSAAADVLAKEPFDPDNPLLKLENFIITPHMAGLTREAASNVATMTAEGVLAVLAGKKWPHIANREVYEHPFWKG